MHYFSQMLLQAVGFTGLSTYINAQCELMVGAIFQALQGCSVGWSSDMSLTALVTHCMSIIEV